MKKRVSRDFLTRLVVSLLPLSTLKGCALLGGPCPDDPVVFVVTPDGGFSDGGLTDAGCAQTCERAPNRTGFVTACSFTTLDGETAARCTTPPLECPSGRRPEGLSAAVHPAHDAVGEFLARQAYLEAASVPAFLRLADELSEHGAPADLVQAALRAAQDEVRHASMMTEAAHRHGARPAQVEIAPPRVRTFEEIVTENAVEGCVRETLGAMIALWQSHQAGDPLLRQAMVVIAADELTHSELAWQIDEWARSALSSEANERIDRARSAAIDALAADLDVPVHDALLTQLGLPDPASALRLLKLGMSNL